MMTHIFFLIPAYNEADSIVLTLQSIADEMKLLGKKYTLVVCDNGSSDTTVVLAKKFGAQVTIQPKKGYGYTLVKGIDWVSKNSLEESSEEKILVFIDADGQDDVKNIATHLNNLQFSDFSIASRTEKIFSNGENAVSAVHSIVNRFFGILLWLRTGKKFSDLGPFRALRLSTFLTLKMRDFGYGWTAEMQKKIAEKEINYVEFFSSPLPRKKGESKVSGASILDQIRIGLHIIWRIVS